MQAVSAVVSFCCQGVESDALDLDTTALGHTVAPDMPLDGDSFVLTEQQSSSTQRPDVTSFRKHGVDEIVKQTADLKLSSSTISKLAADHSQAEAAASVPVVDEAEAGGTKADDHKSSHVSEYTAPSSAEPPSVDATIKAAALASDVLVTDSGPASKERQDSVDSAEDLRDDGVLDFGVSAYSAQPMKAASSTAKTSALPLTMPPSNLGSGNMHAVFQESAVEEPIDFEVYDTSDMDMAEIRYTSVVFLEKVSTYESCAAIVCTPEAVRHVVGVLRLAYSELAGV